MRGSRAVQPRSGPTHVEGCCLGVPASRHVALRLRVDARDTPSIAEMQEESARHRCPLPV